MKQQKNKTIQLTLLSQVIHTVVRHKTIIFMTLLISLICAGLSEGFTFLLEPHSSTLFPTVDSVPYPQYIGTWTLVYTIMDILTAISTVGFTLIPLAFIYKAEHPDAAPIGIDLLSSIREILLLLLFALLTTLPKHLINCGYDMIKHLFDQKTPIFYTILTALLLLAEGVGNTILVFWLIPKKTAVIASSQSYASLQTPPLKQLILVLIMLYGIMLFFSKLSDSAAFPYSLLYSVFSNTFNLLHVLIWYRAMLPIADN